MLHGTAEARRSTKVDKRGSTPRAKRRQAYWDLSHGYSQQPTSGSGGLRLQPLLSQELFQPI
jgi:hypothetical protein